MKPNERVRKVYRREKPDQVPLLLDLSHWYKKNNKVPFSLTGFNKVEQGLVDLYRQIGAIAYVEMGGFYVLESEDPELVIKSGTADGVFTTRITTPLGELREERIFNAQSYSYGISKHLLESVDDFLIVEYMMERLRCQPKWERYRDWQKALGDLAYSYAQLPYSGSGYLMARHMGIENAIYAVHDAPDKVQRMVGAINACNLRILDALLDGPFETLIISDNYDSNVQTMDFFNAYARDYYVEVARRLHSCGKTLAIHVDGESRGILARLAACGVDCADALTPAPMFAKSPEQMRDEAGPDLILSGGIPATLFAGRDETAFIDCVRRWLDIRLASPQLFLAAGDQVPPEAPLRRIALLPELIDKYGRY